METPLAEHEKRNKRFLVDIFYKPILCLPPS